MACDILLAMSIEFSPCLNNGVEPHIYRNVYVRAVCTGAGHMEVACQAMKTYAASCQAKGITVGSWIKNTPCSAGCSDGCHCPNRNVFDVGECVPYSQCGCVHDRYIKKRTTIKAGEVVTINLPTSVELYGCRKSLNTVCRCDPPRFSTVSHTGRNTTTLF
ncbi:hypothetical protein PAMA_015009 [Pampus argenteus]